MERPGSDSEEDRRYLEQGEEGRITLNTYAFAFAICGSISVGIQWVLINLPYWILN